MIPSGPFLLQSGVILTTNDPTQYQPQAVAVQIQNSSGFLITVQIGGANYLIQPFAASTVPTNNSYQINVTPGLPQASFGSLISFAWLQPDEPPPMADGPLTQGNTQSLGLLSSVLVVNDAFLHQFLPAPPLGYVYSLYSVTLPLTAATGGAIQVSNMAVTIIYFPSPAGSAFSFNLGAIIAATAVGIETAMNSSVYPVTVTLRYDLFPQPIS